MGRQWLHSYYCIGIAWDKSWLSRPASSEAADALPGVEDPRDDFLPLINAGKQRGSENEGMKEGMGKKGGKERRLTNKQKSPNPSERRLQNKLKLLWQLVCVGSNTRLRMHRIKTSVMFSS